MNATTPIIQLRNVSKIFSDGPNADRSGQAVTALQNVDLTIAAGEFISVVGPSGCGKSTLMRIVGDLESSSSGEVRVNGKTPHQARTDRDYGIVFQSPTLYDWRTVRKNVELPLEVMRVPKNQWQQRASEMLALVGLSDFHNHYPWQLSGGMQQRVSIARALAFDPSILLMDEPFGALDEFTRERMNMELLNIWQKTGKTVIFITHSIAEAVFLASRVVVMSPRPGRIASVVTVDLPYPRTFETRETGRFFELTTEVRETLKEEFTRADA
jgi:NitT/TauT family transport system ATP-binding protein